MATSMNRFALDAVSGGARASASLAALRTAILVLRRVEICNAFDDDCDGEIDNDACPSGYVCAGEACVPSDQTGGSAGGAAASAGGAAASAGGAAASSGGAAAGGSSVEVPNAGTTNGVSRESGCAIGALLPRPARAAHVCRACFVMVIAGCLAVRLSRRRKRRQCRGVVAH